MDKGGTKGWCKQSRTKRKRYDDSYYAVGYTKIHDTDVLGSTVESARSAVESALYALENPLSLSADISDEARAAKQKEREFYEEFLKLL